MNSIALSRTFRLMVVALLMNAFGAIRQASAQVATDPILSFTVNNADQTVVLGWFGVNGVVYQVQSSSNLTAWSNMNPVLNGAGAPLSFTHSIAEQNRVLYRLRRVTVTAVFDSGTGVLSITGDDLDNTIVVSRNAAGALLVNNGAVAISGGNPTVANTTLIQIFGLSGNDQLSLNETNGAVPKANMFGEAGDDTLTGGSGGDILSGGVGMDTLFGRGGVDTLIGGDDADTITGGDADDVAQMGSGNDRFVWNPGDDTDVVDGGDGIDTTEVNGGGGAEVFSITANGIRVRFDRIDPAPFSLDLGTFENLVLNANGGNDSLSCTGNLAALIQITADGGAGDDTLLGSNGVDLLLGGDNNDTIDGNQGNDSADLGAGDDSFQWDPGDGSDTVEGGPGTDTLVFNGSAGNEKMDFSAVGSRLRLFRDLGNITMDVAGVETARVNALGGTDVLTVNDLSATEVTSVNLNLASTIGGGAGDAMVDSVIVNGTSGMDTINVSQAGTSASITGLMVPVAVLVGDATDAITVNGQGGNDTIDASTMATQFALTVDGGAGDDTITGSVLADVLIGGDDQDTLTGRQGADTVFGGSGNDTFLWNPGEGNDVLEGQAGTDTLLFTGANIGENLDASPNGARLRFFRDVANVTLDCDDLERVQVNALGGADTLSIGELTATDVTAITVDLAAAGGGGDAQPDSIIINGTQGNDTLGVSGSPGTVTVTGLSASVAVTQSEPANDTLTLNAVGGLDTVDASALPTGVIKMNVNGGLGNDTLLGSQGGDSINGGDGDDVILGGGGDDTLTWNPGDDNDTFEGQAGSDTLQFNGAAVAETIDLSANGGRLVFFRNIANVVMDCNDVETVRYEALGGADIITVNNLSATDVTAVRINLASTIGGNLGDAAADSIIVNGTAGDDTMTLVGSPGIVTLLGLSAQVAVSTSEVANDRITLNTLGGADTLDASGLQAGVIALVADGGDQDDILIGSAGPDTLLGGAGDDILIGGSGVDVLDGGTGNNTIIQ